MTKTMIKTILTDLDGVIRLWTSNSELSAAEEALGIPKGTIFGTCFDAELLIPAITGKSTDEAWRTAVQHRLSEEFSPEVGRAAVHAWNSAGFDIDEEVLPLYRKSFPQAHLVLVTNATSRLKHDLASTSVLDDVDTVINSSEVGYAKPDKEIFELALAASGAAPDEAIFIDDSKTNVVAASKLGMHAHLYQTKPQLAEFIQTLL